MSQNFFGLKFWYSIDRADISFISYDPSDLYKSNSNYDMLYIICHELDDVDKAIWFLNYSTDFQ